TVLDRSNRFPGKATERGLHLIAAALPGIGRRSRAAAAGEHWAPVVISRVHGAPTIELSHVRAMAMLTNGKVVVITGGASGIGRATAFAFARQGASVVIGDIDARRAEDTVESIRDKGGEATCVCVDVTRSADVQQMVQHAVDQYGGLDYAFNNAGFV